MATEGGRGGLGGRKVGCSGDGVITIITGRFNGSTAAGEA
jgi:hypothetical protein